MKFIFTATILFNANHIEDAFKELAIHFQGLYDGKSKEGFSDKVERCDIKIDLLNKGLQSTA